MSTLKSNRFHSFGLALQEALDIAGITPASLARITGKDKGQISKYIHGKIVPKRITQLELTNPIGCEIVEVEGEWELVNRPEIVGAVNESKIDYSVNDLNKEKELMESIFLEIRTLNTLFDKMIANEKFSESEKKAQLEMIKEKLVAHFKNILYKVN